MKKIIAGFENLPKRELLDCRITAFREIMGYYGIVLDSYSIYLLSSGIGFQFGRFIFPDFADVDVWFAGSSIMSLEEELMNNISVPRNRLIISNDDKGWEKLKKYIDNDIPLLVMFDSRRALNEKATELEFTILNVYSPSITVFTGYDTVERLAYITLNNTDEAVKLYQTNLDDFLDSRGCDCFPVSPGNICFSLEIDLNYRQWFNDNYRLLLKQSLLKTCERMLGDGKFEPLYKGVEFIEGAQGIEGMKLFIKVLETFGQQISEQEQSDKSFADKIFVIKFLIFRSNFVQGSYTCYREEFGKSLKKASINLQLFELLHVGEEFINVAYEWRTLIRLIYNVRHMINRKLEFIDNVIEKVSNIYKTEEKLFIKLRNCLL